MNPNRRSFIAGVGAIGLAGVTVQEKENEKEDDKPKQEKPKKLDAKLVGQFVGSSHGNLKVVKELLQKEPMLVNAAWDWAGGDWETGLNAASHVGNRDIAECLLENGARLDVCAAVMLGMDGIVNEMLKVNPNLHTVRGAHQIPLLHHAVFGGEKADGVLNRLLDSGADIDLGSKSGMTSLMAAATSGRVDIVEMLVQRGADVEAKNAKSQTALELAKKRKQEKVVRYLESLLP